MMKLESLPTEGRFKLKGELDVLLVDPTTKKVVDSRHIHNMIVDGGEIWIAELLAGQTVGGTALTYTAGNIGKGLQYVHVGTNGNATTYAMVALQGSTASISGSYYTTTVNDVDGSNNNKITVEANFTTANGNGDLREAGIFSGLTYPTGMTDTVSRMFNRSTFPIITKTSSFELTLRWTITIGTLGA